MMSSLPLNSYVYQQVKVGVVLKIRKIKKVSFILESQNSID